MLANTPLNIKTTIEELTKALPIIRSKMNAILVTKTQAAPFEEDNEDQHTSEEDVSIEETEVSHNLSCMEPQTPAVPKKITADQGTQTEAPERVREQMEAQELRRKICDVDTIEKIAQLVREDWPQKKNV